jgi:hypothetical protein
MRLLSTHGARCPLCRAALTSLSNTGGERVGAPFRHVRIDAGEGGEGGPHEGPHLGVTVANSPLGVRVVRLARGDLGARHLAVGDHLLAINGIPALHHREVVRIAQASMRRDRRVALLVAPPVVARELCVSPDDVACCVPHAAQRCPIVPFVPPSLVGVTLRYRAHTRSSPSG